jgi:hypothetical protein
MYMDPCWQDLERALAVVKTRADEALQAKADAEGSLATLHHRHADMEVPLGLPPSPPYTLPDGSAMSIMWLRIVSFDPIAAHLCLVGCRLQARYNDMQTKTTAATNEVMRLTVERNALQNKQARDKVGP